MKWMFLKRATNIEVNDESTSVKMIVLDCWAVPDTDVNGITALAEVLLPVLFIKNRSSETWDRIIFRIIGIRLFTHIVLQNLLFTTIYKVLIDFQMCWIMLDDVFHLENNIFYWCLVGFHLWKNILIIISKTLLGSDRQLFFADV